MRIPELVDPMSVIANWGIGSAKNPEERLLVTAASNPQTEVSLLAFGIPMKLAVRGAVAKNFPPLFNQSFRPQFVAFLRKASTRDLIASINTPEEQLLGVLRAWLDSLMKQKVDPYDREMPLRISVQKLIDKDAHLQGIRRVAQLTRAEMVSRLRSSGLLDGFKVIKSSRVIHLDQFQLKTSLASGFDVVGSITLRPILQSIEESVKRTKLGKLKDTREHIICNNNLLFMEVKMVDATKLVLNYTAKVRIKITSNDRKQKYELVNWLTKHVWVPLIRKNPLPNCRDLRILV